ncbi:MAG: hypothetical protein WDM79_12125 [Terricaulis sp.]
MSTIKLSPEEEAHVKRAMENVWGPEPESENAAKERKEEIRAAHQKGEAALRQAEKAARKNDLAGAKRWTDVANQMVATARRLDEFVAPPEDYREEEEMRAEIRGRIAKFVNEDVTLQQWEMRAEIHAELCAEAARTGSPMPAPLPPRPPHWTDDLPVDLRERLLREERE